MSDYSDKCNCPSCSPPPTVEKIDPRKPAPKTVFFAVASDGELEFRSNDDPAKNMTYPDFTRDNARLIKGKDGRIARYVFTGYVR